jgi:mono/diheme cytochrome c family protein
MSRWTVAVIVLVLSSAIAACGGPASTPTPTVVPGDAAGAQLYATNCAGCHGQTAQGTGRAPAIAGNLPGQVISYVREPAGRMPSFGPERISDAELEAIAAWVADAR